jgi:hypothetical protein
LNTAPSFAQLATTLSGDRCENTFSHISAWGRAVEKVLSKQMALNGRTAAKRRPDSPSTVEKLGRGHSGGEEPPSPAKTIDLVSELNRIWDDPRPAADKPLEPPATPKVE